MKNRVINTFAIIGVVTSIILACSSVLEETVLTNNNRNYTHIATNNSIIIFDKETGDFYRTSPDTKNSLPVGEWTVGLMSDNAGTPEGPYEFSYASGYLYVLDSKTGEIFRTGCCGYEERGNLFNRD